MSKPPRSADEFPEKKTKLIAMAGRLLRCILILILVSFTVISYFSKSRTMAKLDFFKTSEPDFIATHMVSKNPGAQGKIRRRLPLRTFAESIEDAKGNSSKSHTHIQNGLLISSDRSTHAEALFSSIISRGTRKYKSMNNDTLQKGFSKTFLDSKHILGRKPMELLSIDTEVPVRMPLVGTIYEHGHQENEIDMERICPRGGVFTKLLILITSALHHGPARMSIRQTWMHYGTRRDVGMAFVLGRGTNKTLNKAVDREDFMYRDLIRGHFIDSYSNLTLKTISLLEWVDLHCPRAKYILKTDDDMFINVPKLMTLISTLKASRSIYGRRAENWKPIRNRWSKYHITKAQYAKDSFPYFTTGPAYLLTGDIVHALYMRSLDTAFLKLEDVFTTGIVAGSLNIRRINVRQIANTRTKFEACHIRDRISIHMVRANEQYELWKMLLDDTVKCVKK
ncbi:beta-1,3-galactosyltransferase 5 isoform X1 [Drosophila elegans]|uniref:beta-1,3-galactosyltransferase 5 isoform X1 n=2 Tax=Drosophila elegans TaxID=30023 RepID=UPI0007E8021C|nr:beta-1,3-galactosyltransferase 5 isoform X1 [Drosophila elegans]